MAFFSLITVFGIMSVLSEISLATAALFVFPLAWLSFSIQEGQSISKGPVEEMTFGLGKVGR